MITFGRVSRIAQAVFYQRPDQLPVDPLEHFKVTRTIRVEAIWNLPGTPPLGHIVLVADRNMAALDFKSDRAMTTEQARDAAKIFARAIAAATEVEQIAREL